MAEQLHRSAQPKPMSMERKQLNWERGGEEWSDAWGNSEAQWFGTILPRIGRYLPAETILEIAPGWGRWTDYLKDSCRLLQVVDVTPSMIENCRRRFGRVLKKAWQAEAPAPP